MADGSVIIDTELDRSGLKTGLAALAGDVQMGINAAIAAASAALAAGVAAAVKYGAEYESAFAGVKKTVDTSMFDSQEAIDSFFGDLSQNLLAMSERLPFAAADIASVTEAAGQLGIQNDALLSFTETMVNLGVATNLTADEAATQLARFANIVGMPQTEFEKLGSTVVALGNNLATTEADIVNMGMRLAGAGTQVGMTEAQIMALAGAMSSVGMEAEAGGSSISRVLTMMQVSCETGGEALNALASIAGMTADEFKIAFEQDATGALMAFLGGLQDTERNGKSAIGVIAELGEISELSAMDTVQVRDALLRASNASDLMANSLEIANTAWAENTALSTEAAQRYETLESKSIMLANSAKNLGIALYQSVEDNLKEAVSYAQSLVQELESAFSTGGFAGLASAVGDVLAQAVSYIAQYAPTMVRGAVDLIHSFIQGLISAAPEVSDVAVEVGIMLYDGILTVYSDLITLGGELIIDLANSITENSPKLIEALVGGVTQMVTAIAEYLPLVIEAGVQMVAALTQGILEALPGLAETVLSVLSTLVESLIGMIPTLVDCVVQIVDQIVDTVVTSAPMLLDAVLQFVNQIISALPEIISKIVSVLPTLITAVVNGIMELVPQIVQAGFQLFIALIEALPSVISEIVTALPEIVTAIVGGLLEMIPMLVDCGVKLLVSLIQALPDIIYQIVEVLPQIVMAIIETLVGLIPEIITCGIQLLTSLVSALPQIIAAIIAVIPSIIMSIIAALIDNIPLIIQCGIDLLTSLITDLPQIIVTILTAIPQIVASLVEAIVSNVGMIAEAGIQLLTSLVTSLPQIISTIIRAIPQIIQAIVQSILSFKGQIVEAGSNLLQGMADGIGNAIGSVVARARQAAANVVSAVKGFFGISSPSKLFKNEIGKNLMLGLAGGIVDNGEEAVKAAQAVADQIADVEFTSGEPDPGDGKDYDAIAYKVKAAVQNMQTVIGTEMSSGSASGFYKGSSKDTPHETTEPEKPRYVYNVITVDGKEAARELTPYIEKELDWRDK